NGYVEESIMPRLFRESPLNAIWEGSGNVIALDVTRAIARNPESLDTFLAECGDAAAAPIRDLVDTALGDEANARRLTESMALAWAAQLMRRHTPNEVGDTYTRSRVDERHKSLFGTLPTDLPLRTIAARAVP
ncbi:MAG: DNA alkylation response protein, partial [Acidimicrobiia bacterium]